jgi:hypothetical protein
MFRSRKEMAATESTTGDRCDGLAELCADDGTGRAEQVWAKLVRTGDERGASV